jgi:hypothetical protein
MATITITTTPQQDARIAVAFREDTGRDPTVAEIKEWLIARLREKVFNYERQLAANAIQIAPFDPS